MSLSDIPFGGITEADVQNMLSMKISESTTLDYKQQTYGPGDDAKREFLKDISAFANTLGGDIIIGVVEDGSIPTAVVPFEGDPDQETRRLEQIALFGIEPRIGGLRIRAIPVIAGGNIIILRIPKSFIPPHRVIANNSNRFWARAGTIAYEPSVQQLRQIFNDAPRIAERIRSFQTDRLIKIVAGETPTPLKPFW